MNYVIQRVQVKEQMEENGVEFEAIQNDEIVASLIIYQEKYSVNMAKYFLLLACMNSSFYNV